MSEVGRAGVSGVNYGSCSSCPDMHVSRKNTRRSLDQFQSASASCFPYTKDWGCVRSDVIVDVPRETSWSEVGSLSFHCCLLLDSLALHICHSYHSHNSSPNRCCPAWVSKGFRASTNPAALSPRPISQMAAELRRGKMHGAYRRGSKPSGT